MATKLTMPGSWMLETSKVTEPPKDIVAQLATLPSSLNGQELLKVGRDTYQIYLEHLSRDTRLPLLADSHMESMANQHFSPKIRCSLGMRAKAKYSSQLGTNAIPRLPRPLYQQVKSSWQMFFAPNGRGSVLIHQLKLDLAAHDGARSVATFTHDLEQLLRLLQERERFTGPQSDVLSSTHISWLKSSIETIAKDPGSVLSHKLVLLYVGILAKLIKSWKATEAAGTRSEFHATLRDFFHSLREEDSFGPGILRRLLEIIEIDHMSVKEKDLRRACSIWSFYQAHSALVPAARGAVEAAEAWRQTLVRAFHLLGFSPPQLPLPITKGDLLPDFLSPDPSLRFVRQHNDLDTFLQRIKGLEAATSRPSKATRLTSVLRPLLLKGPPGTGKSFAAKVIAAQAGLHFVKIDTTLIKSDYQNRSATNLRKAWEQLAEWAVRNKKSLVVLIDECESLTGDRTAENSSQQIDVVNHFLQLLSERSDRILELPSKAGTVEIYIVLTTNQSDRLDAAFHDRVDIAVLDRMGWRQALEYIWPEAERYDPYKLDANSPFMKALGYLLADLSLRELETVKRIQMPPSRLQEQQPSTEDLRAQTKQFLKKTITSSFQQHFLRLIDWQGTFQNFLLTESAGSARCVSFAMPFYPLSSLLARDLEAAPMIVPFRLLDRDLCLAIDRAGLRLFLVRGERFCLSDWRVWLTDPESANESHKSRQAMGESSWTSLEEISTFSPDRWSMFDGFWSTERTNVCLFPWSCFVETVSASFGEIALQLAQRGLTSSAATILRIEFTNMEDAV